MDEFNPEVILGPPGCGKTTSLLNIVEQELARGIPPELVGFFSFTKKATQEAISRASEKFGYNTKQLPYFRTLHSMCFQALGMSSADVFEGRKVQEFGDWLGVRLSQTLKMDDSSLFGFTDGDRAMHMENMARVMCVPLRQLYDYNPDGLPWVFVDRIARGLKKFKEAKGLHDYTDMLQTFTEIEWAPDLELLVIDESQDLSRLQWKVVEKLASRSRRVVVAGDDDQAIYRWAGAAVEFFVKMRGETTVLGQSWRVPVEVQDVSHELIQKVRHRRPKEWKPTDKPGEVTRIGDIHAVDFNGDDILVLARNVFSLRNLASNLKKEGYLYELRGNSSIRNSVLSAVRLWEELRKGKEISVDQARFVYEQMVSGAGIKRGFKKIPGVDDSLMVNMDWLKQNAGLNTDRPWFEALGRIPLEDSNYLRAVIQRGEKLGKPRIRLSTIHGSKGGEAEHVVLIPDMAKRTYLEYENNPEDEARVWYVGVTRTRKKLSLVKPSDKLHYVI